MKWFSFVATFVLCMAAIPAFAQSGVTASLAPDLPAQDTPTLANGFTTQGELPPTSGYGCQEVNPQLEFYTSLRQADQLQRFYRRSAQKWYGYSPLRPYVWSNTFGPWTEPFPAPYWGTGYSQVIVVPLAPNNGYYAPQGPIVTRNPGATSMNR